MPSHSNPEFPWLLAQKFPIFSNLDDKLWERIQKESELRRLSKGFCDQSLLSPISRIKIVGPDSALRVTKEIEFQDKTRTQLKILGPGDALNLSALFEEDSVSDVIVKAYGDNTRLIEYPLIAFKKLLTEHPSMLLKVAQCFSQACAYEESLREASSFASCGNESQVAFCLKNLSEKIGKPVNVKVGEVSENFFLINKMTRINISEIIGCTREMAGQSLKNLAKAGHILTQEEKEKSDLTTRDIVIRPSLFQAYDLDKLSARTLSLNL